MDYIEVIIAKGKLLLTNHEILSLLQKDPELLQLAIKRGKQRIRAETQSARLAKKRTE